MTLEKINAIEETPCIEDVNKSSALSIIYLCSCYTAPASISEIKVLEPLDILYLLILFKIAKRRDEDTIYCLENSKRLVPLDDNKLFVRLLKKGIISLAPDSPYNFKPDKNISLSPFEEYWKINLSCGFAYINIHKVLLKDSEKPLTLIDKWKPHLREIWLGISLDECIEYLNQTLFEYEFEIELNSKLKNTLLNLLKTLPPSHCFQLINNICFLCKNNFEPNNHNKDSITNFIITELDLSADKLQQGKLNLTGIDRPYTCPRSILSYIFFNELFKFKLDYMFGYTPLKI